MSNFESPHCDTCGTRLHSVFSELSEEDVEKLSLHKGCDFHKAGSMLFQEGGYPAGVYCINRGKIKLFKTGRDGREQIVRLAREGDLVGYRSLISGEPYMASASVLEDAAICFIPKDAFLSLLRESPAFSMHMMGFLARDLKKAEQGELSLAQETVKERLAETLMILKEFFGVEEDGSTIKTNMTREEIASIVGTATETVIRLLSEFRRRKLIALDGKHIKILNPDSLRRMTRIFD